MELTGGTFQEEVHDVLANDEQCWEQPQKQSIFDDA
jgi:hypothetical protein